jgi:hypothetical protein
MAVPLAREALVLARQIGAPALIAAALLVVGVAVAETDPGQARVCLRESRELSTALGPITHPVVRAAVLDWGQLEVVTRESLEEHQPSTTTGEYR